MVPRDLMTEHHDLRVLGCLAPGQQHQPGSQSGRADEKPRAPILAQPAHPAKPQLTAPAASSEAVQAPARQPSPPAADDAALLAQDRAGSDDQPHRRQALTRHRPRKQRQPARPRQTRMSVRPLALSHSELMAQHKDLGVLPPPLPPRQAQQRHGTGDDQEDKLQPHKPEIIPRPGSPRAEPNSQR